MDWPPERTNLARAFARPEVEVAVTNVTKACVAREGKLRYLQDTKKSEGHVMLRAALFISLCIGALSASAQTTDETEPAMTMDRLATIVETIDPEAKRRGPTFELSIQDVPVIVIADPRADRMRAMVPIRSASDLDSVELMRLMQANFDSALDARYAIAQGRLWGVFIHPLSPLERDQFLSGLAQTVNVALSYGQTYSGGASVFGGGDSNNIYRQLLEDLKKRGEKL